MFKLHVATEDQPVRILRIEAPIADGGSIDQVKPGPTAKAQLARAIVPSSGKTYDEQFPSAIEPNPKQENVLYDERSLFIGYMPEHIGFDLLDKDDDWIDNLFDLVTTYECRVIEVSVEKALVTANGRRAMFLLDDVKTKEDVTEKILDQLLA